MKTYATLSLLALACATFGADDIRSKITDGKAKDNLASRIDPDKSIYGIPFGTTEEEFISMHGKPAGYVRLSGIETAMIYGKSHAFVFAEGKLVGLRIANNIVDWKLSNNSGPSPFDGIEWQLSNGIEKEMNLAHVKKILGDKLSTKRYQQYYYMTDKAQVELDFSHYTSQGDGDEAYKVYGIFLKQGAAKPERNGAWPEIAEEFGGVGIILAHDRGAEFPKVRMVTPDGPADKAGVRPGMAIIAVDGMALSGKTLPETVTLLRGKPGSSVMLEILDATAQKTNKMTITRILMNSHRKP
jgi:hypothetical protein